MDYTIDVDVIYKDKTEDTVDVEIDLEIYSECEDIDEKIDYIKKETKKQYKNVKKVEIDEDNLEDIENYIKDIDDTSDWTGEEDFDEFMEHEDYE